MTISPDLALLLAFILAIGIVIGIIDFINSLKKQEEENQKRHKRIMKIDLPAQEERERMRYMAYLKAKQKHDEGVKSHDEIWGSRNSSRSN